MKKTIHIKSGDKFGWLTALRYDHTGEHHRRYFLFRCNCGKEKIIQVETWRQKMSEIKVRAWDEYTEYMFYSDKPEDDYFFAFNEQGVLRGFVIRPPRPSSDPMEPPEPYTDDYPVMLFIGLHGRNNVEIYEGYIFKYYDASVPKGTNPQKSTTVCWS
ncbi:hypothetical protein LCGC14_2683260, partial [marine sediment metagenome]